MKAQVIYPKVLALTGALLALAMVLSSRSSALEIRQPFYSGTTITGPSESGAPAFRTVTRLDIDQASGSLYAVDLQPEAVARLFKFGLVSDESTKFSALGKSFFDLPGYFDPCCGDLEVDNSGSTSQGRFYVTQEQIFLDAFSSSGAPDPGFDPLGGATSSCGLGIGPDGFLWINKRTFDIREVDPFTGKSTGKAIFVNSEAKGGSVIESCEFEIDSKGNFYVVSRPFGGYVIKFDPAGRFQYQLGIGSASTVTVDPANDNVLVDDRSQVEMYSPTGTLIATFGDKPEGNVNGGAPYTGLYESRGVTVDDDTGKIYVSNGSTGGVDVFDLGPPVTGPEVSTDVAVPTATGATLKGALNPSGVKTTKCFFQWGETTAYGTSPGEVGGSVDCAEGTEFEGSVNLTVDAQIAGLDKGTEYDYRLVIKNLNGVELEGVNRKFRAQGKPVVVGQFVDAVKGDVVRVNAELNPEKGDTSYQFEYGPTAAYGTLLPLELTPMPSSSGVQTVSQIAHGLPVNAEFHYHVIATNDAGTTVGPDKTFRTFPPYSNVDLCPNALARQQSGAVLLARCRAYELVSASNSGGYNVVSSLVPGQNPLDGYPGADDRLLYSVVDGGIPGVGSPTNRGPDPYMASRNPATGWQTRYVGIPADGTPSPSLFASTFFAGDEGLDHLAFSGPDICAPCFDDGSSGIPVRLPNGDLVQGMKGSIPQPTAAPKGTVLQPFSASGDHFIFGADRRFEPAGNEGSVSIYDRNLGSATTQVVSTLSNGDTMTGTVSELGVSANGSRIVVGQEASTDGDGNSYWHLYVHVGNSPDSIDLMPSAAKGALYAGMSADGSRVFFVTPDSLILADSDSSADVYEADLTGEGAPVLRLVSTEGSSPSNDDACSPAGTVPWNKTSGPQDCAAVAFAGGVGVSSNGTIYFISPEVLAGPAEANQPNVYVRSPGGDPRYVTTIDTTVGKPLPTPARPINPALVSGLGNPQSLAVDESNGDIYVAQVGGQRISRFTSAGTPHNFSVPGGSNQIEGLEVGFNSETAIAVDNAPASPFKGDFYTKQNGGALGLYAPSGALLGEIGGFAYACGVAVNQSNGVVYVGDYSLPGVWRLEPSSPSGPIDKSDYSVTRILTAGMEPCQVAADSAERVYVSSWSSGPLKRFKGSEFSAVPTFLPGKEIASESLAMYTDAKTNDLYVTAPGGTVRVFGEDGEQKEALAPGTFKGSHGVAVNAENHKVYVADAKEFKIAEIGYVPVPYAPVDNPAVAHAVHQPTVRDSSDLQVTPDGRYAAFSTARALTGFENHGSDEVFRFDLQTSELDCVSCAESRSRPPGDAYLTSDGLSLVADGRVFLTTPEALVLRDTDDRKDAYEWTKHTGAGGDARLISSGTSQFDSGFLSASADGRDAFFFTRDTFVKDDHNGTLVKVYDAREGGGFFHIPQSPQCAASDECHGPGTEAPPALQASSRGGTPANLASPKCRKGFRKRHGKCVKKHGKGKSHKRAGGRRNGRGDR